MRSLSSLLASSILALTGLGSSSAAPPDEAALARWKDVKFTSFSCKTLEGRDASMQDFQGKVCLVVNVASDCGYTRQYTGLEKLYGELKDKGLVVLGFPCNDFGGQEPGTAEEIRKFCTSKYSVTFPMFAKVQTKAGPEQTDLYSYLAARTGSLPTWNFGKYLIGRDGQPIAFFSTKVEPDAKELREAIDKALAAPSP